MTKKALLLVAIVALMVAAASAVATAAQDHAKSTLEEVGDSGVHGKVHLRQLSSGGTRILVQARGLTPGNEYVSLYYDNPTCELEPYSEEDVIGTYTANPGGNAHTSGIADDDLDEIHSVSVRSADTFELLACATVDN
jgi:energy-coupling factor transporter ATP-binding protein EcfA2